MKVHIGLECHLRRRRRRRWIWRNILGSAYLLMSSKSAAFTSRYAEIVMKICSPYDVTLFNSTELCNELSHAASKRNMQRSSPGISRYSPGKSPRDSTELSLSSSSGSGVFLMRPEDKQSAKGLHSNTGKATTIYQDRQTHNLLSLNINKTYLLWFRPNNKIENTLELNYLNDTIQNVPSVMFLGLLVDDTLSWDQHINYISSKLSTACYAIWTLTPLLSTNALRMLYFSYAHSVISYGIIFWGNSGNSIKVFRQQKKILRTMTNSKKTESCKKLFKEMKILPFYCQYIFSLVMYMVNNKHLFTKNLEIHSHDTRKASNFHVPTAKLTKYQKGAHYMGIKIFNHLPDYIKGLINEKQAFKNALERFLLDNIFYSINDYLNYSTDNFKNHNN